MMKKLFIRFLLVTFLFGASLVSLHLLLYAIGWTPKSLLYYLPLILIGNLVIYIFYFHRLVKEAQFKGAGTVTVPTVFLIAMTVLPPALLNWISLRTDVVKDFGSVREAANDPSPFFTLRSFTPLPDQLVDQIKYDDNTDDDGNLTHTFDYIGLVPLRQEEPDASVTGWIEFTDKLTKEGKWSDADLATVQTDFQKTKRTHIAQFPYDSIVFFSALDDDLVEVLSTNSIDAPNPFFMHASLESASSYRTTFVVVFGGLYALMVIFFVGAVKLGHHEAVNNDD